MLFKSYVVFPLISGSISAVRSSSVISSHACAFALMKRGIPSSYCR
jgi:hypothetical protein